MIRSMRDKNIKSHHWCFVPTTSAKDLCFCVSLALALVLKFICFHLQTYIYIYTHTLMGMTNWQCMQVIN